MQCRTCFSPIEKRTRWFYPQAFMCFPCINQTKENTVREANAVARATGNRKSRRATLASLRRAKRRAKVEVKYA